MSGDRRKEVTYHLPEERIDELLREAEDDRRKERLGFLKNLYYGDTIAEAADREGRSAATGRRWVEAWNEGGLEGLMPSFGGGRPPKLDEDEQKELVEMLRDGQPWKSQEIQHLLNEEFDVEYHPDYLGKFLRSWACPTQNPVRSVHIDRRIQKRFSTSASATRSTRMTALTTERKETTKKGGLLRTMSVRMAELFWGFSMPHNRSHTTIPAASGT